MIPMTRRRTLGALATLPFAPRVARAQAKTITFGYLADPSHEAVMWPLRNGKVRSDRVRVEGSPLDIPALIQATAARSFDVVQTAAMALPRARERGLDLRIIGTGLRNHGSGEGGGIWVKKDGPIQSAADLKGKRLAIYSIGSAGITLVRIALAEVHGLNVAARGGDVELLEMPPPAMPAALAGGRVDAATLIHAQAYRAMQGDDFRVVVQTAQDITTRFGLRGVSAVLAGYGEKLDAAPDDYVEFLRVLHASMEYARSNPQEVFPAVGQQTGTDPAFFEAWFSRFSEFPVLTTEQDVRAIDMLWSQAIKLGLLNRAPPAHETIWSRALNARA
ncbi:MAG TPA: MqnA/MqnD/SBP family protein [Falsiroseomonas sp.]|jgi:NitT/TauT family transport system substrate-binding protein|nr:MqnA/MqnD/SBP family protein [Falsiroseomonas sp.]